MRTQVPAVPELLASEVIFNRPLNRKDRLGLAWSIVWHSVIALAILAAFVLCIWLAFAIPDWGLLC
jgi:hypothetical protein